MTADSYIEVSDGSTGTIITFFCSCEYKISELYIAQHFVSFDSQSLCYKSGKRERVDEIQLDNVNYIFKKFRICGLQLPLIS